MITDLAENRLERTRGHSILSASVGLGASIGYFVGALPLSDGETESVLLFVLVAVAVFVPSTACTLWACKEVRS